MKPDDDYLLKLGFAHYWFQYVEWGVIYAVHHATGKDLSVLSGANPGEVSRALTEAWNGDPQLEALAKRYKAFVKERNRLAHSHPATDNRDGGSRQRLYRHDVKAKNRPATVMWIDSEWLDEFIAVAQALNRDIQTVSQEMTPDAAPYGSLLEPQRAHRRRLTHHSRRTRRTRHRRRDAQQSSHRKRRRTVGGDRNYDTKDFVHLRQNKKNVHRLNASPSKAIPRVNGQRFQDRSFVAHNPALSPRSGGCCRRRWGSCCASDRAR